MKYLIGAIALLLVLVFGGFVATYVFSGLIMFAGLVALCETIPLLKWIFRNTSQVIDLVIFGFSIYAVASMGVTVAIGLSVAGLLFTVFYKPMLKRKKVTV